MRCALQPRTSAADDGRVRLTITMPPRQRTLAGGGDASDAEGGSLRMSVHLFVADAASSLVKKHGAHGAERAVELRAALGIVR